MARTRRITQRGALLAVDLALVDRVWTGMPARDAIALVTRPAPIPRSAAMPGTPEPAVLTGLDATLAAFAQSKTLDLPLASALRAKRALGIPWRWLTSIPGDRDETRADERLMRWAEATRLPEISTGDVIVVSSAVERTMIGASEVRDAFSRWSTAAFTSALEAIAADDVTEILIEAWDDAEPLMAVAGVDDEESLWNLARTRLSEVRTFARFARENSLALIPWTEEIGASFLRGRAAARR